MKFSFENDLEEIVASKKLIEIQLNGESSLNKVGYIVAVNKEFLTFADINPTGAFVFVSIYRMDDINAIKVETVYLSEFSKKITDDSIYEQALKLVENIEEYSFDGFISAFEGTKQIIEIDDENDDELSGRIVSHDDKVVVLDEYYAEYAQRFSRSYIRKSNITKISVGAPWLQTISRALTDRNL